LLDQIKNFVGLQFIFKLWLHSRVGDATGLDIIMFALGRALFGHVDVDIGG
jgi:hypothetical protein